MRFKRRLDNKTVLRTATMAATIVSITEAIADIIALMPYPMEETMAP